MAGVYVAAGSNVQALRNLRLALAELRQAFPGLRTSPAYRNAAVGFVGDDFINLVVGFDTDRGVAGVIAELHRIEAVCDRTRDALKWAPRAMDLDILLYGDLVLEQPGIKIPRPDLIKRPYMLGPLADIAPQVVHPSQHRTIGDLWQAFDRNAHAMTPIDL